jgi:hypothetical protein
MITILALLAISGWLANAVLLAVLIASRRQRQAAERDRIAAARQRTRYTIDRHVRERAERERAAGQGWETRRLKTKGEVAE